MYTKESAQIYLNERKMSPLNSPCRSAKQSVVSNSNFSQFSSDRLKEEKTTSNLSQIKDQSSILNLVEKEKEALHHDFLPCIKEKIENSRDEDRLILLIKEIRASTTKRFDHILISCLRWLVRLFFLLSCILASVGFYLQTKIDESSSNLISGICKNRITTTYRISESSRILFLMTSYSTYRAPLITLTERNTILLRVIF